MIYQILSVNIYPVMPLLLQTSYSIALVSYVNMVENYTLPPDKESITATHKI